MPLFAGSHIFSYSKKKINTLHFLHYKQTDQNTSYTAYYCNKKEKEPNDTIASVHKHKWFDSYNHFLSAEKSFIDQKNDQNKTNKKMFGACNRWIL